MWELCCADGCNQGWVIFFKQEKALKFVWDQNSRVWGLNWGFSVWQPYKGNVPELGGCQNYLRFSYKVEHHWIRELSFVSAFSRMRMKTMLTSQNIILMPVKKRTLIRKRNPIGAVGPSLDLPTHDLHHAHPLTQAQGLGPGKRVQVKGNARQNVSI